VDRQNLFLEASYRVTTPKTVINSQAIGALPMHHRGSQVVNVVSKHRKQYAFTTPSRDGDRFLSAQSPDMTLQATRSLAVPNYTALPQQWKTSTTESFSVSVSAGFC
jgi:hypothetical protein